MFVNIPQNKNKSKGLKYHNPPTHLSSHSTHLSTHPPTNWNILWVSKNSDISIPQCIS